jgi:hypothetical protein
MPRFKDIYGPFLDRKRCRFDRPGLCGIYISMMLIRSLLYSLFIGALLIRPNLTVANRTDKNHVLTNIQHYRCLFMVVTNLATICGIVMLESLLVYPYNILSCMITYEALYNTARLMVRRLRYFISFCYVC